MNANSTEHNVSIPRAAAGGLFILCLLGALVMHTVPALLTGLLAFVLTRSLLAALRRWDTNRKLLSHELLSGLIVGVGSLAVLALTSVLVVQFLGGESLREFMLKLAETVSQVKRYLPESLAGYIPDSLLELRAMAAGAIKEHANAVAGFGSHLMHSVLLTLIGWITGVLAAVSLSAPAADNEPQPVFFAEWSRLWALLSNSFKNVAWAQAKIAAINALMTGLFLLILMPLLDWRLPYAKTLVLTTFLFGLIPIVGNLLSNTLICILALSVAFPAALVSLGFLVVVHKLEYFVSARIQGHEIGAKAWELIIVLFAFELLFGPAGMVAAPVIYAFIKADLKRIGWLR